MKIVKLLLTFLVLTLACWANPAMAQVYLLGTDGSGSSAFQTSTNWSNGQLPGSGNNYYVGPGLIIRTPTDNNVDTFGGNSLTLAGQLDVKQTNTVIVNNLSLSNGIVINAFAGGPSTNDMGILGGTINIITNSVFDAGGDVGAITYLQIQSTIGGTGNLTIQRSNVVTLTATNTYSGTVTVVGSTLQLSGTASLTPASLVLESGVFGGVETNVASTNIVQPGGSLNVGYGGGVLRVGYRTGAALNAVGGVGVLNVASQSNFTVDVGEFSVGNNTVNNDNFTTVGTALLATNNMVTATNIFIGDSAFSSGAATSTMVAGSGSNYFNTPLLTVGMRKVTGQLTMPSGGVFRLDNAGGPANLTVGGENFSTGGSSTGTMDVSGGTFVGNLGTLTIGMKAGGSSGGATGTLNIGASPANNLIASNVVIGSMAGAGSGTPLAQGTLTMGGGSFVVTNNLILGSFDNGLGSASGTLNLNGGRFTVEGNLLNGNGTATVNATGGTLVLSNTAGAIGLPLTALNVTNATLNLSFNGSSSTTNIVATAVNASGTIGITIGSVVNVTGSVTNPIISYTGSDPYANLTLAPLPSGYTGSLVDDTANQRIDLGVNVSSSPSSPALLSPAVSGTNLTFQITSSQNGHNYVLEATPQLVVPVTWTRVQTNAGGGTLTFSAPVSPGKPHQFFRVSVQ
jgi:hypothetical protein